MIIESIHARLHWCFTISKLIPQVQLMVPIFNVLLLHKTKIHFLKNFLIDAQLADLLHYDVTKLN